MPNQFWGSAVELPLAVPTGKTETVRSPIVTVSLYQDPESVESSYVISKSSETQTALVDLDGS